MTKVLRYCYFIAAVVLIGATYSCYDDDVANIEDSLIFTPEYSVPIGFGEFTMLNVVSSPTFDTIPADITDTINWNDTLVFEYDGKYYYLPPGATFDTILHDDFDFSMIEDWLDNATYLMFRMNMENAIPGSVLLQVEFRDANNNLVFSLFDDPGVLVPAAFNGQPAKKREETYLTPEEINSMRNVTQVYSYVQLNIQNLIEGASYFPEQYFKLQMGLRVGLKIDSNETAI